MFIKIYNYLNNDLESFQNGVDQIVDGCTTYGSTPTNNTPNSIVTAISNIYTNRYNTGYNAGVAAGQANPTLMSNTFVALDYSSLITSQSNGLKSDRTAVLVKVKGKSKVSISCWESGDNIQIRGVFILSTGAISSLVSGASVSVPTNALYLLMRGSYSNAHLYSISIS